MFLSDGESHKQEDETVRALCGGREDARVSNELLGIRKGIHLI